MASEQTIILTRNEYDALLERNSDLEDRLAALEADDGVRVPHEVALAIINGKRPIVAFRNHQGITLQELSKRTRLAVGYLSEIERGLKSGSVSAMARIASALGTTIDVLTRE
ncbi:MAG: helix-turn-helix transcriptional regulator [Caldilineaceae bacterium]|nr:helix-turn-helix transcriptional regulator [Caldilineaceae bacterium]